MQHVAGNFADFIQPVETEYFLVRGDLEYGIGRRVNDRLTSLHVLFAKVFDDFSPAGGKVSEYSRDLCLADELIDHRFGKTIWIGGECALQNDSRHLPMTRRRVFAV